jgi:hypothetical protein
VVGAGHLVRERRQGHPVIVRAAVAAPAPLLMSGYMNAGPHGSVPPTGGRTARARSGNALRTSSL